MTGNAAENVGNVIKSSVADGPAPGSTDAGRVHAAGTVGLPLSVGRPAEAAPIPRKFSPFSSFIVETFTPTHPSCLNAC